MSSARYIAALQLQGAPGAVSEGNRRNPNRRFSLRESSDRALTRPEALAESPSFPRVSRTVTGTDTLALSQQLQREGRHPYSFGKLARKLPRLAWPRYPRSLHKARAFGYTLVVRRWRRVPTEMHMQLTSPWARWSSFCMSHILKCCSLSPFWRYLGPLEAAYSRLAVAVFEHLRHGIETHAGAFGQGVAFEDPLQNDGLGNVEENLARDCPCPTASPRCTRALPMMSNTGVARLKAGLGPSQVNSPPGAPSLLPVMR